MKNIKSFSLFLNESKSGLKLVGKKGDFEVYFNAQKSVYEVFYKGDLLITKERLSDVKSYLN